MHFILGIIVGLLIAVFIAVILTYFRRFIETRIEVIEKTIENAGPRPKGEVIIPEDEGDITRKEIIARNQAAGKDTPLSDLL